MSELLGAAAPPADLIKDASIETFEDDVLRASMETPVIVDFWAEWCGPCKQLAPALEKHVRAANGKVRLVKVDIDKNQMLASQLRIQSIPTVYAFYQGRPVDGFQGAVPESEIKAFIERLTANVGNSGAENPIEEYLEAGEAALENGDAAGAAQLFAQIAQAEPENVRALAGLAKCQLAIGDVEQARATYEAVPEDKQNDPAFDGIKAALLLAAESPLTDELDQLKALAAANPEDLAAQFDYASALLGGGAKEPAIDVLLSIIAKDRAWNEEAARKKLLTVFDALGPKHPLTLKGRRKLSSILFS